MNFMEFGRDVLDCLNMSNNIYTTIKDESRICVDFHSILVSYFMEGRVQGIWTHIPNEGKTSKMYGYIQKKMGKIKGMPDYIFIMKNKAFAIEFKTEKGRLSPSQKKVREWFVNFEVPYYVHTSVEEAVDLLKQIKFII